MKSKGFPLVQLPLVLSSLIENIPCIIVLIYALLMSISSTSNGWLILKELLIHPHTFGLVFSYGNYSRQDSQNKLCLVSIFFLDMQTIILRLFPYLSCVGVLLFEWAAQLWLTWGEEGKGDSFKLWGRHLKQAEQKYILVSFWETWLEDLNNRMR